MNTYNNLTKHEIAERAIRMTNKASEIVTLIEALDREFTEFDLKNIVIEFKAEIMRAVDKSIAPLYYMEGDDKNA